MTQTLLRARATAGLDADAFDRLLAGTDDDRSLLAAAGESRRAVFGRRMRVYAPVYLSNLCVNECLYCGFRVRNRDAARRTLTHDELRAELSRIVGEGHRHLLLVSGEVPALVGEEYLLRALAVCAEFPQLRRVDLEIGPLPGDELSHLARAGFHSFVLYQETYDRTAYARWHVFGPKADYDRRRSAVFEALEAGFSGAGIGVLLGLVPDWKAELSALFRHAKEIEARFQILPAISLPRFRPADGVAAAGTASVTDAEFARAIACLRLGLPDAELVLSTREPAALRDALLDAGVTTVSAGSRTNPGGYGSDPDSTGQFEVADDRPTAAFVDVLRARGFDPFPFA